jgi:folylpolyglutamate synthase/dihydropteroate synthase
LAVLLDKAEVRRPVERCLSIDDAFHRALAHAAPEDRVVVFGSFFSVAAAMREIERSG